MTPGGLRCAMLCLHGAVMYRRPIALGNDTLTRFIYVPGDTGLLAYQNLTHSHGNHLWRILTSGTGSPGNIEVPFDSALVAQIPEQMFVQYINHLTR